MTGNVTSDRAATPSRAGLADPLFIIGTGRCGSTVFHDVLANHPRVTWFSRLMISHPRRPQLNSMLLKLRALPGIGHALKEISPVEAYPFWEQHFRGFTMPCRDLTAEDASPYAVESLRAIMPACVTRSRPQLLCKITRWPRLGFLHAVFPNAKFIHVIRDGRAVASSLLRIHFWRGWLGPQGWGLGPLSAEQNERWQKYGQSFVALAGLEWEILMDAYERARRKMPADRLLEIRYEDLCADPLGVTRTAIEFAGLEWSPAVQRSVAALRLRSQNDKWKQGLSPAQQAVLNDCMRDSLPRWGYRI